MKTLRGIRNGLVLGILLWGIIILVVSSVYASTRNIGNPYRITYIALDSAGVHIPGQAVNLSVEKASTGAWLDFDDDTFKSSGWGNKTVTMVEDAVNAAYTYVFSPPISETTPEQYIFVLDNANATYADHQAESVSYQNIGTSTYAGGAVTSVTGSIGSLSIQAQNDTASALLNATASGYNATGSVGNTLQRIDKNTKMIH